MQINTIPWKSTAQYYLRTYLTKKETVKSLNEQLSILEEDYVSLSGKGDSPPVMGIVCDREEKLIRNIAERDHIKARIKELQSQIKRVDAALNRIGDDFKLILTKFYIDRNEHYIDDLCDILCAERTKVYKMQHDALKLFADYIGCMPVGM